MAPSLFQFKKFAVSHGSGSMKVGVDAVLIGSWAGEYATRILDVGTGCGVISLILAQRFPNAKILGIDIDEPSVIEAAYNFNNSPWRDNLSALLMEFPDSLITHPKKFDLIVSNPPYFNSGITEPHTRREKARHQDSLSVFRLIKEAPGFLSPEGRLSVIFPIEFAEQALELAKSVNLFPVRVCRIRDKKERPEKRIMMEMSHLAKTEKITKFENLTLFESGNPTESYLNLCKDFYLKF